MKYLNCELNYVTKAAAKLSRLKEAAGLKAQLSF